MLCCHFGSSSREQHRFCGAGPFPPARLVGVAGVCPLLDNLPYTWEGILVPLAGPPGGVTGLGHRRLLSGLAMAEVRGTAPLPPARPLAPAAPIHLGVLRGASAMAGRRRQGRAKGHVIPPASLLGSRVGGMACRGVLGWPHGAVCHTGRQLRRPRPLYPTGAIHLAPAARIRVHHPHGAQS